MVRSLVAGAFLILRAPVAAASQPESGRVAMPEPLLIETATDLDSDEAGELEVDLTGASGVRPALADPSGELEAEWRVTRRLGLALGLGLSGGLDLHALSARGAASWALYHDLRHDLHVQLFASGRYPLELNDGLATIDHSEPTRPFEAGVHGGIRQGWLTLRGQLGVEAGGRSAHLLPVRAALVPAAGGRAGFGAIELMADWARADPWTIAPEGVLDLGIWGLPVRLGLALPWRPSAPRDLSAIARVIVEVD